MTKGDPHRVKELLSGTDLLPVYSTENLAEIHRSKGREADFLRLLDEINAQHLVLELDSGFKYTGKAFLKKIPSEQAFEEYIENINEVPGDFGLSDLLLKFYGGNEEKTFNDIFEMQKGELANYLHSVFDDINEDELNHEEKEAINTIKSYIDELPDILANLNNTSLNQLDKLESSALKSFEDETGICPKVLNNISGTNIILQIWDMLVSNPEFNHTDLDTFFGIKPHQFEQDSKHVRTQVEKVNGIYHQLNFLGYYRDSNMRKERRFKASFSDMTHAGIASLCHFFLCRDDRLVKKASAAYEYLSIPTQIIHYSNSKKCD